MFALVEWLSFRSLASRDHIFHVVSPITGPETQPQQPAAGPKMADVVEEEMSRQAARPRPQLVVDAFYEGLHPGSQAGKLRASFDSYASMCVDGSVDDVTLKMLKKHYDSSFEANLREGDQLEWEILSDLLVNLTVAEDCSLGLSLLLTEFRHRSSEAWRPIFEDSRMSTFILHAASLDAVLPTVGEKTFKVVPGLLYAAAKTLHDKNRLDSEAFKIALEVAEVE